jgi:hypothetical protein
MEVGANPKLFIVSGPYNATAMTYDTVWKLR